MSLKAKIEAVIYASEEPVTLTQLVGLLGEEAQAELDRAAAAQQMLLIEAELEAAETEPALGPDFDSVGGDGDGDAAAVAVAAAAAAAEPASEISEVEPLGSEAVQPTHGDEAAMNEAPGDAEAVEAGAVAEPTSENPDVGHPGSEATEPTQDGETVLNGAPGVVADETAAAAKAERARLTKLRAYFRSVLDQLVAEYVEADRGLEIREVAGGFRFATKPEYHDAVRGFVKSLRPPLKLTLQALETLAVVAYKQPVTAPEISEIRGVDSSGVLMSLLARKLISTAGRKQVIGRPILYKTTKEFLLKFGLKDVAELPSIEEFEKMAGQMAEQEEIAMGDPETANSAEERLESDSEAAPPEPVADEVIVDGRVSGLPPRYGDADEDPSAAEAEIQQSGE
jgi:segregation and condensation protein B